MHFQQFADGVIVLALGQFDVVEPVEHRIAAEVVGLLDYGELLRLKARMGLGKKPRPLHPRDEREQSTALIVALDAGSSRAAKAVKHPWHFVALDAPIADEVLSAAT